MSQVFVVPQKHPREHHPQEFHQDQGESHLVNLCGIIIFLKKGNFDLL